jgi:antitoxin ParD1/3/4
MATMNISLPDSLKEWAEAQVTSGKFANMSDFIRDLMREQKDKQSYIAYVSKALKEAEASGYVPLDTNELRRELGLIDESNAA